MDMKLDKTIQKSGGPYTKVEREKRQDEVYRLHFSYGYSARKISQLMKINIHTINNDINYWYYKLSKQNNKLSTFDGIGLVTERLENQRTRLREKLDKNLTESEKITVERMIADIDFRIINIYMKIYDSQITRNREVINEVNQYLKDNGHNGRVTSMLELITISKEKRSKYFADNNKAESKEPEVEKQQFKKGEITHGQRS